MNSAVIAARPHHWTKNLLVFAPIILGHRWSAPPVWYAAGIAFLAFCCFASATYILNDLLDANSDRDHPLKKNRPIASGALGRGPAALATILLLAVGSLAALQTARGSRIALVLYVVSSVLYSKWLKSVALIDVLLLGGFYTIRVLAGGAATGIAISPWTLAFSMFLFLSLAIAKRYIEVDRHGPSARRAYRTEDKTTLQLLGVGTGLMSIQVLALYINSPEVLALYSSPRYLWLMCPVILYWIARVWLRAARRELTDDPLIFALKDPASYLAGACALFILVLASGPQAH